MDVFQHALEDLANPFFVVARDQLQKEKEITSRLSEVDLALKIELFGELSIGLLTLLIPAVALSALASDLMISHARRAKVPHAEAADLTDCRRPYYILVDELE